MAYQTLRIEIKHQIAKIVLNRPEKKNAMNPRLHKEMTEALEKLRYDDDTGNELLSPPEAAHLRRLHAVGFLPDSRVLTLTIPPGHCFVLGDNGPVSVDSRDWGPVPMSAILGRALS